MSDDKQTFHVGDAGSNPAGDASTYATSQTELTPISPQSLQSQKKRDLAACGGAQLAFTLDEMRAELADRPEFRFASFEGMTVCCYMVANDNSFSSPLALECRGVTFGADGAVIGRPLPKFFNVGERADTLPDVLDWDAVVEVYDKRDGSLIHTVATDDGYRLKSKKSFTAPQVAAAQAWIRERPRFHELLETVAHQWTVIMEWTAPDNRVVLDYTEPQLTILHLRHNETGKFFPRAGLEEICAERGIPLVNTAPVKPQSLLDLAQTAEGIEGWVLQFRDGTLMKLKTRWYLDRHHWMTTLRERDVAAAVLDETLDDIKTVLAHEPETLARIAAIEACVVQEIDALIRTVDELFASVAGKDRKTVAIENRGHPLFAMLMHRYSGKEPDFKRHYRRAILDERWSLAPVVVFGSRQSVGGDHG